MSDVLTKQDIKNFLLNGSPKSSADAWCIRALTAIYQKQTASEKSASATLEHNGVGFSGFDANILTSFAEQVKAGRTLSRKQLDLLRKKMPKYAGQLARIASGEMSNDERAVPGNDTRWTIEPIDGEYWLCEHGVYGRSSVLAGQPFRQRSRYYNTLAEAVAAHPEAKVIDFDDRPEPAYIPQVAPEWFDPANAGERWSEED